MNEKIEKIKENPRINFSDSLLYESKFYVFFVFCAFVSGMSPFLGNKKRAHITDKPASKDGFVIKQK